MSGPRTGRVVGDAGWGQRPARLPMRPVLLHSSAWLLDPLEVRLRPYFSQNLLSYFIIFKLYTHKNDKLYLLKSYLLSGF